MNGTIKITLELTPEGKFSHDAGSEEADSNALNQARALKLGTCVPTCHQLGKNPNTATLLNLTDCAEQVIG